MGRGTSARTWCAPWCGDGQQVVVADDLSTGDRARLDPGPTFEAGRVLDRDLPGAGARVTPCTGVVPHRRRRSRSASRVPTRCSTTGRTSRALVRRCSTGCRGAGRRPLRVLLLGRDLRPARTSSGSTRTSPARRCRRTARASSSASGCCAPAMRAYGTARHEPALLQRRRARRSDDLGDPGVFNLIPMVFERLERGERPRVFGGDYPTPDGATSLRDYVPRRRHRRRAPGRGQGARAGPPGGHLQHRARRGLERARGAAGGRRGHRARRPRRRSSTGGRATRPASSPRSAASATGSASPRQRDLRQMVKSAWSAWQAARACSRAPYAREPGRTAGAPRGVQVRRSGVGAVAVVRLVLLARALLAALLRHGSSSRGCGRPLQGGTAPRADACAPT